MQFLLGFNFVELVPTIIAYSILSILSIGVIFFFKKKSDKELKELEKKIENKDQLK